jgi:hypothetical protein
MEDERDPYSLPEGDEFVARDEEMEVSIYIHIHKHTPFPHERVEERERARKFHNALSCIVFVCV